MSYRWAPYVPVAKRHANAKKQMDKLRKKGGNIQPIEKTGRKITHSFWGSAWCNHLEDFSDYDNRLPRGRTLVRNGSVCHLTIKKGQIDAMVSGSKIYKIKIKIKPLSQKIWLSIQKKCAGGVGSMLELLQGKLSDNVMKTVTDTSEGLFPQENDINLHCDCPDWATMCKHVAAVLYGIGARLDSSPELLFLLRDVDHMELIDSEIKLPTSPRRKPQVSGDLSDIFGIDLVQSNSKPTATRSSGTSPSNKKTPDSTLSPQPNPSIKKKKIIKQQKSDVKQLISTAETSSKTNKHSKSSNSKARRKMNISQGITAYHVKKLQKELGLTDSEFSKLLGKATITIRNWKKSKGVLNLQQSSLQVLKDKIEAFNTEN